MKVNLPTPVINLSILLHYCLLILSSTSFFFLPFSIVGLASVMIQYSNTDCLLATFLNVNGALSSNISTMAS
jgi:hypothetical protein